jgi:integrase/recombinase XerD
MTGLTTLPETHLARILRDDVMVESWLYGKSGKTKLAYALDARRFRDFVGKPLADVTLTDAQDYARSIEKLSTARQARAIATIKSLLSHAHRMGGVPFNVGTGLTTPKVENTLAERIVDRDSIRDMLRLSKGADTLRDHTLLTLLYYAGLRISEAVSLEWRHVVQRDAGRGQVTVTGKGGKTRSILLPPAAWSALTALRATDTTATDTDKVFRARRDADSLSTVSVHKIVKVAAARAGLPSGFSAHWLRHGLASHALDAGAPAHVVQQTLGHASLTTTSRYAHARPSDSASLYLDRC